MSVSSVGLRQNVAGQWSARYNSLGVVAVELFSASDGAIPQSSYGVVAPVGLVRVS